MQKMNIDTDLSSLTKINSRWIIDLNVKPKIGKLLEENIGENLDDFGHGDHFLNITAKAWFIKERIDKLDFIKTKNFYFVDDNVKRMRRQA